MPCKHVLQMVLEQLQLLDQNEWLLKLQLVNNFSEIKKSNEH
jgi:hypothetical protein